MKKILLVSIISLSMVGCSNTEPTEEEMRAYLQSQQYYIKVVL